MVRSLLCFMLLLVVEGGCRYVFVVFACSVQRLSESCALRSQNHCVSVCDENCLFYSIFLVAFAVVLHFLAVGDVRGRMKQMRVISFIHSFIHLLID